MSRRAHMNSIPWMCKLLHMSFEAKIRSWSPFQRLRRGHFSSLPIYSTRAPYPSIYSCSRPIHLACAVAERGNFSTGIHEGEGSALDLFSGAPKASACASDAPRPYYPVHEMK